MNAPLFAEYIKEVRRIAHKGFCGKITLNFQFGNVTGLNVGYTRKLSVKKEKK